MHAACLAALLVAQAPAEGSTGPIELEAAIEEALAHANEMIQARQDRLLVEVDYLDALSAILPRFDLSLAGGELFSGQDRFIESRNPVPAQLPTEFPQFTFGPFVDGQAGAFSHPQFSLGLSGRQLIYDGGRWWTALARVDDLRAARSAAIDAVRNRVRAQVVQGFYAVERARQAIETFQAQLAVDREQVARARAIVGAGRGNRVDVATAERNLIQDEIQLDTFLRDEARARRTFNLLLGRAPHRPVRLALPAAVTATTAASPAVPPLDELLALALDHRPELADMKAQLAALDKEVGIASAGYLPTVSLDASYRRSSRKPERVLGNPFENYLATLDLTIQWNLFEGRATEARVQRARITLEKLAAAFEALERQVLSEVEDRREEVERQRRVHALALRQIGVAEEAVRLARGLFAAGRGTSLELRDAELRLTQARLTLVSARLDAEVARADLAYVVGAPLGS